MDGTASIDQLHGAGLAHNRTGQRDEICSVLINFTSGHRAAAAQQRTSECGQRVSAGRHRRVQRIDDEVTAAADVQRAGHRDLVVGTAAGNVKVIGNIARQGQAVVEGQRADHAAAARIDSRVRRRYQAGDRTAARQGLRNAAAEISRADGRNIQHGIVGNRDDRAAGHERTWSHDQAATIDGRVAGVSVAAVENQLAGANFGDRAPTVGTVNDGSLNVAGRIQRTDLIGLGAAAGNISTHKRRAGIHVKRAQMRRVARAAVETHQADAAAGARKKIYRGAFQMAIGRQAAVVVEVQNELGAGHHAGDVQGAKEVGAGAKRVAILIAAGTGASTVDIEVQGA